MKIFITPSLLFCLLLICNSCNKKDEVKNPCEGITCLNGGTCANGSCVCAEGWTGANCSQQITPSKITITKIEVTRFPPTDNGGGWDPSSGPEIYPTIKLGNSLIWQYSSYYTDADYNSVPYVFIPAPYIELTNTTSQYTISLWDYDTIDADDYMGGIYFYPYSSTSGFPNTITIDGGGDLAFKLYLTYSW